MDKWAKASLRSRASCSKSRTANVNAGGVELGDALAADKRVGIDGGDDATRDSCGDERVGAGAGAAVMAAGLEGDVGGDTFYGVAVLGRLLERDDLSVVRSS